MRNEAIKTQKEKRKNRSKKNRKDKSKPVVLASKLKEKYTALDEETVKRKKKGGYSYEGTK